MRIWQPRIALPSAKLQCSRRVALAVYDRMYGNIFRRAGQSLHYVDFATRSMPTSEGPAIYASTLSKTATMCDFTEPSFSSIVQTFKPEYSPFVYALICFVCREACNHSVKLLVSEALHMVKINITWK